MPRIVHMGVGNFHRAHQAWYTAQSGGWTITGVVMSNRQLRDQFAEHNNAYVLGIWGKDGLRTEKISVYDAVLLATEQSAEIVEKIADRNTHIVTLTVTEKGYYLRPNDGRLDVGAKPILQDLGSDEPTTAIGLLAAGLIHRGKTGAGPLTVLSCDNLAANGSKLRQAVIDYLSEKAPNTMPWLKENVTFPNSMVDRITPKLSQAAVGEIEALAGGKGQPTVGTESFSEWVIEDEFVAPRPDWESAGAKIVPDVASFEERKLRLLNASHSYLAYAGLLAGHRYVHEAIADPKLNAGVNALWDEAGVTVSKPAADTLGEYRTALLDRFTVAEMRHDLGQIAMDGSVKLRERLVPILQARSRVHLDSPQTCRAIAAWIVFVRKAGVNGTNLSDPNADQLLSAVRESRDPSQCCENLGQLIGLPGEWLRQVSAEVNSYPAEAV